MKKQILIAITLGFTSFHATAESKSCTAGYDNLEHLGDCLGSVVDSSIGAYQVCLVMQKNGQVINIKKLSKG